INVLAAVVDDMSAFVMLDLGIHVELAVNLNQFRPFGIVKGDFVITSATLRAVRLTTTNHPFPGKIPWRHLTGVIHTTSDDRPIGIALDEINDYFLPDARNMDAAPGLSRPGIGDTHPAGAVLVFLSFAVPEKLHLNPAIFVSKDF